MAFNANYAQLSRCVKVRVKISGSPHATPFCAFCASGVRDGPFCAVAAPLPTLRRCSRHPVPFFVYHLYHADGSCDFSFYVSCVSCVSGDVFALVIENVIENVTENVIVIVTENVIVIVIVRDEYLRTRHRCFPHLMCLIRQYPLAQSAPRRI